MHRCKRNTGNGYKPAFEEHEADLVICQCTSKALAQFCNTETAPG